jgi:signal transduction histidine kinase
MVLGLLFASPMGLLAGQIAGSAVALMLHRRQRPVKLAFNLGQLAIQTTTAVAVFRVLAGSTPAFDGNTLLAAAVSMIAALFVGHTAVLAAIRASGGRESRAETARVLAVSMAGTFAASLLAIVAAVMMISAPGIGWVGFAPVVLVFIAYRAYIAQSQEKGRVEALFDAATALHRSSDIDRATVTVAERVLDLVKAEPAAVILFPRPDEPKGYVTVVDVHGSRQVLAPLPPSADFDLWSSSKGTATRVLASDELQRLGRIIGADQEMREAVADLLTVSGEPIGLLVGINRIGDVSALGESDARVLATLGAQLSTFLENGWLSETLTEIRRLKDQMEALLESKDRLVASVSHELRTPLTGVIGLTSLVREEAEGVLDGESIAMLDLVVEQGNELSNIIEDLLAHARAEAGSLTIRPETFDLVGEANTVAATHGILAAEAPNQVSALGDPLRVRQILRNLVTNARRYGGPTIRLVIQQAADSVSVSVVDDGHGVPPELVESIFEPYRSAHNHPGQPGSVGLGLAVSRSISDLLGGDLSYRRSDQETWFTLTLPAGKPPTDPLTPSQPTATGWATVVGGVVALRKDQPIGTR